MMFVERQWYESKAYPGCSSIWDDVISALPYAGVIMKDGQVNYWQYGVSSLLPKFCTIDEFIDKININRPLTDDEVKAQSLDPRKK